MHISNMEVYSSGWRGQSWKLRGGMMNATREFESLHFRHKNSWQGKQSVLKQRYCLSFVKYRGVPKRLKGLHWKCSRRLIAVRGFKSLRLCHCGVCKTATWNIGLLVERGQSSFIEILPKAKISLQNLCGQFVSTVFLDFGHASSGNSRNKQVSVHWCSTGADPFILIPEVFVAFMWLLFNL